MLQQESGRLQVKVGSSRCSPDPSVQRVYRLLRDAYKALGDDQKSAAELGEIKRIARENPSDDQNPFSMENFLFTVRPPG